VRALVRYVCLLFLVSALAPGRADAKPSRKLLRQALKHEKNGLALLKKRQYDRAIEELQVAYSLGNKPLLLFHLGEAHNSKQEYTQALYYYRTYQELDPKGAGKRRVAALIESLAALEAETESGEPDSGSEEPVAEEPPDETQAPAPLLPLPDGEEPTAGSSSSPSDGSRGGGLRLTGGVMTGAGLLLLGGAGYFAMVARDRENEITALFADGATWDPEYDGKYEDGREARRNALILGAAGGAAVLTGAVLYYLGRRAGRSVRIEAGPVSGGGRVSWSCDF
jgi:tetratricopeptide (TPR) repeat protein